VTQARPDAPAFDAAATREVLERAFLLARTTSLHGPDHPLVARVVEALAQGVQAAHPPFALQFLGQATFRDSQLLPLDVEAFLHVRELARALRNLDAQEVFFERVPDAEALGELGSALSRGLQGPSETLNERRIEGLRFRQITHTSGADAENVDPEVFVLTQVTLALADAEALVAEAGGAWPWIRGVAIVRRLERVTTGYPETAIRVIEQAPGEWTVGRRAAAATLDVLLVLNALHVSRSTARAAAHAALIVSVSGLPSGALAAKAAADALPRMLRAPTRSKTSVEPHRLRTSAIVHAFNREEEARRVAVLPMVHLAYELAKRRCPPDVSFRLTRVDLLAAAARDGGRNFDVRWVQALIRACGVVPPGAFVRMANGALGTVVDAGVSGDPWRPRVLVDGRIVQAAAQVTLVSPGALLGRRRA
jgi:hypothetical protein